MPYRTYPDGRREEISMEEFQRELAKASGPITVTPVIRNPDGTYRKDTFWERLEADSNRLCNTRKKPDPYAKMDARLQREIEEQESKQREQDTIARKRKHSANAADILAARKQADFLRSRFAVGYYVAAWVNPDGTVTAKEIRQLILADWDPDPRNVSKFRNIKSVVCTNRAVVGLREDGTCITTGVSKHCDYHLNEVNDWHGIVQISAGSNHVVGLRANGTCISHSVAHFDVGQHVEDWTDIREIVCGDECTVGIKKDGTVVATGNGAFYISEVKRWKNVALIALGNTSAVGLTVSGEVLKAGRPDMEGKWGASVGYVEGAVNIIQLSMSGTNAFALQLDRKLIGKMADGNEWRKNNCYEEYASNILAISNHNNFVTVSTNGNVSIQDTNNVYRGMESIGKMFNSYEQYLADIETTKERRNNGVCPYCGGKFKWSFFGSKCSQCMKSKDY